MAPIPPEQLIEQLEWRYAVKRFDPDRRIDAGTWAALERCMILTPSSYGLQPWKFIVITDPATKSQLPAISWGQKQPQDCSHMVVMAARRTMDATYIQRFMDAVVEQRDLPPGAMEGYQRVLVSTVDKMETHLDWNARQVYIALGQLMVGACLLYTSPSPRD